MRGEEVKHKQREIIFLVTAIGNADNTVEVEADTVATHNTEKGALDQAKSNVREYNMRNYVYKCIPILKIDRGKIEVTRMVKK